MKIPNTTTDYQTSLDILREQRQIRRERFFSSPGLIMGLTVFILIVMAAIIIPAVANVDPNAMAIADRLKGPSLKHPFGTDEFGPVPWARSSVFTQVTSKSWITS